MRENSIRPVRRRNKIRSLRSRLTLELLEPRLNMALDVPVFSSLPGANHTIYLDFDGHVTTGTSWNSSYGVTSINSPAYSSDADTANFSAAELSVIERTFKRVAEDFAPFQVNVTTAVPTIDDLRNTGSGDSKWGVRVVVTRDVAFNCGCGGIAYINSFNWNTDTPVYVFNTGEVGVAEAVSHEVGHSLGLSHDGTSTSSYYQGHGLGTDTAYWSTIMGVGYYVDVSQWDRGEYFGSNNAGTGANYGRGPDDLAIITGVNGFGYKSDDHGDSVLAASSLTVAGTSLSASGLISTRTDVDYFRFTTGAGTVSLNVNPASVGANLDIDASLFNSSGLLVATSNPLLALNSTITVDVPAGEYFLRIDGSGAGNPATNPPTGYSDYGSIGQYSISGTLIPVGGDTLSIAASNASINEGNNNTSTPFTFTVTRNGDTTGTTSVNYTVVGTGSSPATAADFMDGVLPSGTVEFLPGVTSQIIAINVLGDASFESNEGFAVSLSNASPATTTIVSGVAAGTILNDDAAPVPPSLAISATSASKAEGSTGGSTPFTFTITRSGNTAASSSVRYAVSAGSSPRASSNDLTSGFVSNVLVNFAPDTTSVDVVVNVRADTRRESNENFRVTLSNAVGASIAVASANGIILNDDGTGAAAISDSNGNSNQGDDNDNDEEKIAVADPLWMFVPAEQLTLAELSVPVITWIDGTPYIGDLAHDHDHAEHGDHSDLFDFDHDHDESNNEVEDQYLWAGYTESNIKNPSISGNASSAKTESLSVRQQSIREITNANRSIALVSSSIIRERILKLSNRQSTKSIEPTHLVDSAIESLSEESVEI